MRFNQDLQAEPSSKERAGPSGARRGGATALAELSSRVAGAWPERGKRFSRKASNESAHRGVSTAREKAQCLAGKGREHRAVSVVPNAAEASTG